MALGGTVLQVRLDSELKRALVETAARANTTPSKAVRALIETYVRDSHHAEARRQSRLVAASTDTQQTMDEITELQAWLLD